MLFLSGTFYIINNVFLSRFKSYIPNYPLFYSVHKSYFINFFVCISTCMYTHLCVWMLLCVHMPYWERSVRLWCQSYSSTLFVPAQSRPAGLQTFGDSRVSTSYFTLESWVYRCAPQLVLGRFRGSESGLYVNSGTILLSDSFPHKVLKS